MSEDDEFLTGEDDEFREKYVEASVMYGNQMFHDRCEGRPTYAGADSYYSYKSVSTVDINYTDAINENEVYEVKKARTFCQTSLLSWKQIPDTCFVLVFFFMICACFFLLSVYF